MHIQHVALANPHGNISHELLTACRPIWKTREDEYASFMHIFLNSKSNRAFYTCSHFRGSIFKLQLAQLSKWTII